MPHISTFFARRTLLQGLPLLVAFATMGATLPTRAAEPIPVTVSFSILADLVQVVGAERVKVTALVGPNEDAHAFEPKPSHAKTVQQSKLLVMNGLDFEPWAKKLAQSANYRGNTVVASQGIAALRPAGNKAHHHGHHHHGVDPHAWQNPLYVVQYIKNIAAALSALDPEGSAIYQRNAQTYQAELESLDQWAQTQFSAVPAAQRKVITSHDAFAYLGARYQIQFMASHGTSTAAEPSAKQVARLVQQIQREKMKTIFVENMSNPKLMQQISQDTGATVGAKLYSDALSGSNEPGATYMGMMRHNITHLVQSMR
jgi:zinc/manganese transport system substrate-binding protein